MGVQFKNNAGKGLYFAIVDGSGKEICVVSETDVKLFIQRVVSAFNRIKKSECVVSKNTDDVWHRHYKSGGRTKKSPNDYILYYTNNQKIVVSVNYINNKFSKPHNYSVWGTNGESLGTFAKFSEATNKNMWK